MELAPAVGKSGLFRSKRSPRKQIDVIDLTGLPHVCLGACKPHVDAQMSRPAKPKRATSVGATHQKGQGDTHRDYFLRSEKY
jgi:hypothetical protein